MEFDDYLSSSDALRQTESAQGMVLRPGQVIDGMRVLAYLGRGTTGEVWRVHDLGQDRDYALKVFAPAPDAPEQARRRFLTEARALDEFRHPNLMRRYRLQETGDHPYYTMDVLRPLPEQLNERSILRVLEDVLPGLAALHAKGIVHRDLKPSNILLDDTGHAVLSDLGVAHLAASDLARRLGDTRTVDLTLVNGSAFVGTPRYAAPEQFSGEAITPATDIYALGVVIEQLFGNKVPFRWRPLLRHMTMARSGLRLQSVRQVRRQLAIIRLLPHVARALIAAAGIAMTVTIWHLAQPTWIEVSDTSAEIITLGGGRYFQRQMRFLPIAEPPTADTLTATNAIDRQFQKMFATCYRRRPIYIQGKGTLKCPAVSGCEIHLAPGVTFITTGRFTPDGNLIRKTIPPSGANWDDHIGYPTYVVEKGAKLVFTENDNYPAALIRRE